MVQHLAPKDRFAYQGIKVKYIRVAVQRLVMILPVEEQVNFLDLSEKEKQAANELRNDEMRIQAHEKKYVDQGKVKSNLIKELMSSVAMLEQVPKKWRLDDGSDLDLLKK